MLRSLLGSPTEAAREQANNELFDAVRGGDVAAVKEHQQQRRRRQQQERDTMLRLNSPQVLATIFCAPCDFGTCGAAEGLPLWQASSSSSSSAEQELCLTRSKLERQLSEPSSSGSDSERDSMV
mmetsp:Transcript_50616/g.109283  ORF Transcript_50616/g.109283 Transcript_50616/m.109283 type:complete len:124 (+) Transcript_50616:191-562(+)|eukprot:CAMPEP_0206575112 /NCGR_PEP_ID=MMETSP0325_2-20121206/29867_1 /ASSEMBLY_ACC=CAM_ASM_000347 /TAXON_ID=2866 /ORGANISM="Crypthecodinium cohnii, Strain Seligo" /LENGTH=123 /DNA_ID=CAMNT_0054079885 /DNA_START=104 /DNA_END=475 /DNA_ORIENTATION=+